MWIFTIVVLLLISGIRLTPDLGPTCRFVPVCFAFGLVVISLLGTSLPTRLRTEVRSLVYQSSKSTARLRATLSILRAIEAL